MRIGLPKLGIIFFVLIIGAVNSSAQNPVSFTLRVSPETISAGGTGTAEVSARIEDGWHLYSLTQGPGGPVPTRISIEPDIFKIGKVKGPKPEIQFDANFKIDTEKYSREAIFTVPFSVAQDAPSGVQVLNLSIRFQACNDSLCLPPKTTKLSANLTITGGNSSAKTPAVAVANSTASNTNIQTSISEATQIFERKAEDQPLWNFIWLAMTFGALSLLTPCVFPMIPITVSYFTKHTSDSHLGSIRDALIYTFGIILTFTALGIALALLFGAAGLNRFAANPWINLSITGLFLAFAFSLLGAYDIGVPTSILTKLDNLSRSKSTGRTIGLLLMGLAFSLTSFTCTAPLVGTILVAASQGKLFYPIIGMLAFSSVFALPFFILAVAPRLLHALPRSGNWMNSVKVVMGFLEIGAALKFVSNADLIWGWGIFSREVVIAGWIGLSVLIFLYLLGVFRLRHDTDGNKIGLIRLLNAFLFIVLGFYLLTGLFGRRLGEIESFLPPMEQTGATSIERTASGELTWIVNDYQAALEKAKAERKNVFVDFTGYTCTNCRWMEANIFPQAAVRNELEKYVRVQLFTDGEGEPYEGFQRMQEERFGTVALPLYAIVSPEDRILAKFEGLTRNPEEFVSFLRR